MAQYPDSITITRKATFDQDADGNFQATGEDTVFTSECRAELAGNKPEIIGADGNKVECSWIVYMPKTAEVFAFGDGIELTKGTATHKGSLKQQYNGQFNTRIWV